MRPWTRGQRRKFSHKRACEKKSTSDLDPLADIFLPFSIKFKEKEKKKKDQKTKIDRLLTEWRSSILSHLKPPPGRAASLHTELGVWIRLHQCHFA